MVPPKSKAQLKIAGTLRPDRHEHLDHAPDIQGPVDLPSWVKGEAKELWDLVVSCYGDAGPLTRLDGPILAATCDLWAKFRKASKAAEKDPADKDLRIAVLGYFTAWEKAAGRLGLNPVDRRRLSVAGGKDDGDDRESRFFEEMA